MCWGHELRGASVDVEGSGHRRKRLSGSSGCSENDSFRSKRAMVAQFPAEVLHPRGLHSQGAALHSLALVHNRTFSSNEAGAGHDVLMGVVGRRFGGGAGPFTNERKVVTVRPAVCCGSLVSGFVDCTQDPVVGHPGSATCLEYPRVTGIVDPQRVPADPAHVSVLGSADYTDEPAGGERGACSKPRMPVQQGRGCFRTCGNSNAPSLSGAKYASDPPLLSAWLPAPVQSSLPASAPAPALPAAEQPLSVEGPPAANVGSPDAGVVAVSAAARCTPADCLTHEEDGTLKESPAEEVEGSWQDAATSAGMNDEHVAKLCLLQYQAMMNDSSAVVDLGNWDSGEEGLIQGTQMLNNAHLSSACSGTGFVEQSGVGEEAQTSRLQGEGRQTTLPGCAEPGFPLGRSAGTVCFNERAVAGSVCAASAFQSGLVSIQPAVEEEEEEEEVGGEEFSHDEENKLVATLLLQELVGQRDSEVLLPHDVARPTESSQASSGEAMDGDSAQYSD